MSPILLMTADTSVSFTATVVIAGISIVVGVLLLLILVFQLFGKIVPMINNRATAKEKKKAEKKAAKAAEKAGDKAPESKPLVVKKTVDIPLEQVAAPTPEPVVEQGISGEVVAAIAAAVAATEGSGAVVRSIKRKNVGGRNPWAQAANIENTRPF